MNIKISVAVACFLPGRVKDLSAPRVQTTATHDRPQLLFHQLRLNRKVTADMITIMILISTV